MQGSAPLSGTGPRGNPQALTAPPGPHPRRHLSSRRGPGPPWAASQLRLPHRLRVLLPCPLKSCLVPGGREGGGVGHPRRQPWGLPWFEDGGGRPASLSQAEVAGAAAPVGFCGMWRASVSDPFYPVVRQCVVIQPTLTLNKTVLFIQS